ncbi:MAG: 4-hydroxy-tetrahydrodipicolinate synthase [Chitinophagales bacterium]
MYQQFKGTGVALVTPFLADGSIDFKGLENLIEHTIKGNVEYLVTMGTTGESATLSRKERHKVMDFTIEKVKGRVPIVAGFGDNNTAALIEEMEAYHFKGISAILSASPYYNKPTQEGIYAHYKALAEKAPKPIILYNVPGRTASNITAETTLKLARDFKNIIGIKEASGDLVQCMKIVKHIQRKDFLIISGEDPLTLPMLSFGMDGVISVVANAFPYDFSEMVRLGMKGNFQEASKYHFKLLNIIELLFKEGNPAGIKAALYIRNVCDVYVRLPLVHASDNLTMTLKNAIKDIK